MTDALLNVLQTVLHLFLMIIMNISIFILRIKKLRFERFPLDLQRSVAEQNPKPSCLTPKCTVLETAQ